MTLALCCMSHSPLLGLHDPPAPVVAEVDAALNEARRFVSEFDPEVVVVFGPDHLNGFLYRVMPQFCVGTAATSVGDFSSASGPLSVPSDLAEACAQTVLDHGLDVAVSIDMVVDHGFAQPLTLLFGGIDARPVIPIFINATAPPRSPLVRSRLLGHAVGQWAADLDRRILVVGSGGLSHDPPGVSLANAGPEGRSRLLDGLTADARVSRERMVIGVADEFVTGRTALMPLAPDFDLRFMDILDQNRIEEVDGWTDGWLSANAGRAGHEIRTWVAAFGSLATVGRYEVDVRYYRPIPEWIVSFGLMTARPAALPSDI
jgi:2,3-dihydroxyphenylpropionate 1,2-dioxygenase